MNKSVRNPRRLGDGNVATIALLSGAVLLITAMATPAQERSKPTSATPSRQKHFATPQAAVDPMLAAFKGNDDGALLDIFGHDHEKLVVVTDKVARGQALMELWEAAQEKKELNKDGDNKRVLILGEKDWPLPIPIVKEETGWRFDTAAGAEEIINRRIGKNELNVIEVCRKYVEAQAEYAGQDHDGDQVLEYAQRIGSTPGKHDGLYWETAPDSGDAMSPFGPLLSEASAYIEARKKAKKPIPYHGYYYKLLMRQGENPPGGKYNYVINGNMIGGFAMVVWPADYDSSGIMTFVVSHQGRVFEKDLGEKTSDVAGAMESYNPDKTWRAPASD